MCKATRIPWMLGWAHHTTLQHTATHCNTLQHTATHCNTPQHTATHCNTLHRTLHHILQHATTHTHSLTSRVGLFGWCKGPCIEYNTHGNTLHHTATHCSRLNPHISRHLGRALLYGLREESGSSFPLLGRIKGLFSLIYGYSFPLDQDLLSLF